MEIKFTLDDLGSFKREELYQIAQELKIKGRSKLTKAGLIEALTPFARKENESIKPTGSKKNKDPERKKAKVKDSRTEKSSSSSSPLFPRPGKKGKDNPEKKEEKARPSSGKKARTKSVASSKSQKNKPIKEEKPTKEEKTPEVTEASRKSSQESILSRSFARQKNQADDRKKKGAIVQSVAIPVELNTGTKPEQPSAKARLIEEERSRRHASLKTTMEIPVFSAPAQGLSMPVAEEDLTGDLPADYGETRIVVQIRDPHWAHAYWQIPRSELKRLELDVGIFEFAHSHFVLKVHNVTDGFTQEFSLSEHARSYYFYLGQANTVYQAELGLQSPTEGYTFIALSNLIQTPPDQVAETWAAPAENIDRSDEDRVAGHAFPEPKKEKQFEQPLKEITEPQLVFKSSPQPGGPAPVASLGDSGKPDVPSPLMQDIGQPASPEEFVPTPVSSQNWSSPGVGSFGNRREKTEQELSEGDLDIFLNAVPELILYGKVDTRCNLDFNGKRVSVDPDGSFSLRFMLPVNQSQPLELEAVEPTSGKTRTITAKVKFEIL